tara:strand:- start:330 stop:557 length:228 start_codon:yes stop_codon:yes gene_type:complete
MFNPFVDFSNFTTEQLNEKKSELQKKVMGISNDRIRDQIYAMINQIDLMLYDRHVLEKNKQIDELEEHDNSLSIG